MKENISCGEKVFVHRSSFDELMKRTSSPFETRRLLFDRPDQHLPPLCDPSLGFVSSRSSDSEHL